MVHVPALTGDQASGCERAFAAFHGDSRRAAQVDRVEDVPRVRNGHQEGGVCGLLVFAEHAEAGAVRIGVLAAGPADELHDHRCGTLAQREAFVVTLAADDDHRASAGLNDPGSQKRAISLDGVAGAQLHVTELGDSCHYPPQSSTHGHSMIYILYHKFVLVFLT